METDSVEDPLLVVFAMEFAKMYLNPFGSYVGSHPTV
jgi:hypothetical protein